MTTYQELSPEERVAWRKRVTDFAARSTVAVNRSDLADPADVVDALDEAGELLTEGLDNLFALAAAYQPSAKA